MIRRKGLLVLLRAAATPTRCLRGRRGYGCPGSGTIPLSPRVPNVASVRMKLAGAVANRPASWGAKAATRRDPPSAPTIAMASMCSVPAWEIPRNLPPLGKFRLLEQTGLRRPSLVENPILCQGHPCLRGTPSGAAAQRFGSVSFFARPPRGGRCTSPMSPAKESPICTSSARLNWLIRRIGPHGNRRWSNLCSSNRWVPDTRPAHPLRPAGRGGTLDSWIPGPAAAAQSKGTS
jgi:hypothetical protein